MVSERHCTLFFAQQRSPGALHMLAHLTQFARQEVPAQGTLPQQTLAFGGG
jgi:hypothetical protein